MNNLTNTISENNLTSLINSFELSNEAIGDNQALNLLLTENDEFQDFDEMNSFYTNAEL